MKKYVIIIMMILCLFCNYSYGASLSKAQQESLNEQLVNFDYKNGNLEQFKELIKKGANVNALVDTQGFGYVTALMMLSYDDDALPFVKYLVHSGANVNEQDYKGKTALLYSTNSDSYQITKFLLKSGAKVNIRDREGVTALMEAFDFCDPKIVTLLLKAGANVKAQDNEGHSVLDSAQGDCSPSVIKELEKLGVTYSNPFTGPGGKASQAMIQAVSDPKTPLSTLQKLITQYNVNAGDGFYTSLLMYAVQNSNLQAVNFLIKESVYVNDVNKKGTTALMLAADDNKNTEIIDQLLNAGADLSPTDINGLTALMHAVKYNPHTEIVKTLSEDSNFEDKQNNNCSLDHCTINNEDLKGKTALDYAIDKKETAIIKILKSAGAQTGKEVNEEEKSENI